LYYDQQQQTGWRNGANEPMLYSGSQSSLPSSLAAFVSLIPPHAEIAALRTLVRGRAELISNLT
jgi:hypothetical protein